MRRALVGEWTLVPHKPTIGHYSQAVHMFPSERSYQIVAAILFASTTADTGRHLNEIEIRGLDMEQAMQYAMWAGRLLGMISSDENL